jgi:DNA-binding response OmpR family regulator
MPALLLLTRDPSLREATDRWLNAGQYALVCASDPGVAMRAALTMRLSALLIDTRFMEDVPGLTARLRAAGGPVPCVFLTAAGAEWAPGTLPVRSGDHVLEKPLSGGELRAAIDDVTRGESAPTVLHIGDMELDRDAQALRRNTNEARLTQTEFRLMEYLASHVGSTVSVGDLLENVWRFHPGTGSADLVRAHVRNLRAKLRVFALDYELIQTVSRRGYRLSVR